MKNKGFTTIELVTTFALTMVIVVFLLEIVSVVKYIYVNQVLTSSIRVKQALMTEKIMDDFDNYTMISTSSCGANCIVFEWKEQLPTKLKIDGNTFTYGDYTVSLSNNTSFGEISIFSKTIQNTTGNNSYLLVSLPIKSSMLSGDYGVYAAYQYDANTYAIHGSDFADTNENTNNPIRLLGSNPLDLGINDDYTEAGWLVYQNGLWLKGDITNPYGVTITSDNDVNNKVSGTINITYTVTNDSGTYTRVRIINRK